jgi:hypothetical protein
MIMSRIPAILSGMSRQPYPQHPEREGTYIDPAGTPDNMN